MDNKIVNAFLVVVESVNDCPKAIEFSFKGEYAEPSKEKMISVCQALRRAHGMKKVHLFSKWEEQQQYLWIMSCE